MNRELLRQFFHKTREWSRAHRGAALFQLAAQSLTELAEVDSGFFLYRRRMLKDGVQHLAYPDIYMPWGVFQGDELYLSNLQSDVHRSMSLLNPVMERWMLEEDIPSTELRKKWALYGLLEFGIWPIMSREEAIGALFVARTSAVSGRMTTEMSHAILDSCAAQIAVALDLILTIRIAEHASQTDLLTGIFNRRGLETRWGDLVNRSRRTTRSLVLCLLDVDDFKAVNDNLGHPAGDEVLRKVASTLRICMEHGEVVGRLGGDEFICLYFTDSLDYSADLTCLQDHVQRASGYTVSVGAAVFGQDGDDFDTLYKQADGRLYANKRRQIR